MIKRLLAALVLMGGAVCSAQVQGGAMPVPLLTQPQQASPKGGTAEASASSPEGKQAALIARYGRILGVQQLGVGGLTAWTVEAPQSKRRMVLYTTSDAAAIISGIVWDASGRNLTDSAKASMGVAPSVPPMPIARPPMGVSGLPVGPSEMAKPPVGALVGAYHGQIPESINTVDGLAGIKEGKGGKADTLYVIFDPRCPVCRHAYQATRSYVAKGFSIKWIPAIVLGDPEGGTPLAATVLQAKAGDQATVLKQVLGDKAQIRTQPSKETLASLERNKEFFYAVFSKNSNDSAAGVPVAFYLDKASGKPRMTTGVSELPILEQVFGKL
jgi:thiol:disulfide interchange protein DsbG